MALNRGKDGSSISLQVEQLLDDYCEEVEEVVDKAARGTASATANYLKKHSPRGKSVKHYADGWRSKRLAKRSYVVYNAIKPGLAHLLNNGHAKAGGTGFTKGDGHIEKANEWAEKEFMKKVEAEL